MFRDSKGRLLKEKIQKEYLGKEEQFHYGWKEKKIPLQRRNEKFRMAHTPLKVMELLNITDRVSVNIFMVSQFSLPLLVDWFLSHLKFPTWKCSE